MASARERQAKHRAKIRENPELYKAYLEKDRKRKGSALITAKAQMTVKQREEFLMKERLQLKKLRAAKKPPQNSVESSNATPYRSSQSLGKAVKRACTSLPKSPKKQWCVVTALLVAGSTLTFWIPPFASTSSHSSVFQSASYSCNCRRSLTTRSN